MYEHETFERILRRMLELVPAKFDKREGSIIWDATSPAAVEFQNLYISLDGVLNEVFADTASREYLIKRCAERGIKPKLASYAIVKGKFTPATLDIAIGTRYSLDDLNYIVTEKINDGLYYLECETAGSEPNGQTGRLIPIDYINGLETAEILEVTIPGDDEEDTEALRARYFEAMKAEAYGGNKLDYKNKVMSMAGVGGCKIYSGSQWNGGGTVLIVVQDSNYGVPSDEFIDKIQTEIDPETNMGEGEGIAPIGHFVTVVPANNTVVNIETLLTYTGGASWNSVKDKLETAVDEYLNGLNKTWDDNDQLTVRIAHIESAMLDVPGVIDVQNTTLNGKPLNLTVDKDSLATRGTINGN